MEIRSGEYRHSKARPRSGGRHKQRWLPQQREELAKPGDVGGPGGAGNEVAVGDGVGEGERDELAAGERDLGSAGRIGVDLLPFDDAGSGEDLCGMADGADGFSSLGEVTDDGE